MTDSIAALATQALELAEKATPGPWTADLDCFSDEEQAVACVTDPHVKMLVKIELGISWLETSAALDTQETRDADFIAFARSALPALAKFVLEMSHPKMAWYEVSAIDALRAQLAERDAEIERLRGRENDTEFTTNRDGDAMCAQCGCPTPSELVATLNAERDSLKAQLGETDKEVLRLNVLAEMRLEAQQALCVELDESVAQHNNCECECDALAAQLASAQQHLESDRARIAGLERTVDELTTRRSELLQLVANISQSTPLDSEVSEALEQRGKLIAEIGSLRSLLRRARGTMRIAASYADQDGVSIGMRIHARDCRDDCQAIDAALKDGKET